MMSTSTAGQRNKKHQMKNKIIIAIVVVLIVGLAVAAGFYFTKNASEADRRADAGQPQEKIVTDDFSVNIPAGWQQTSPALGTLAMAVNVNEEIDDPTVLRTGFRSYFAVSYNTLEGTSLEEYLQIVKEQLQQAVPGAVFAEEKDMTINGNPARVMEIEMTQQELDFKVLMAVVKGQEEGVWVMSFNTIEKNWNGYKEVFYGIIESFNENLR